MVVMASRLPLWKAIEGMNRSHTTYRTPNGLFFVCLAPRYQRTLMLHF